MMPILSAKLSQLHPRKTLTVIAVLLMTGIFVPPAYADTSSSTMTAGTGNLYVLNKEHSKIGFAIGHMVVSSTDGLFTDFVGKLLFNPQSPQLSKIVVEVTPGSVHTDDKARDEHLKTADFFNVAKYPVATFENTSINLTGKTSGKLTGNLTLLGVTEPVTLDVTLQDNDLNADHLNFIATGTIKRSDFGMNDFKLMVGDEVTLNIQAEFDRQP